MKGILLLTTVLILSVLPAFAQKTGTIKNADKTELIRLILEDARIYKGYLFSNKDRPVLYFSSENLTRDLVPTKIGETALLLKSPDEIEKEKSRLDVYCAFGKFEIKKSTAKVSFYYYTKDSKGEGFDREVLEYEYRKVSGKWKFVSRKHPGLFAG
jgi:hypothetical protein